MIGIFTSQPAQDGIGVFFMVSYCWLDIHDIPIIFNHDTILLNPMDYLREIHKKSPFNHDLRVSYNQGTPNGCFISWTIPCING